MKAVHFPAAAAVLALVACSSPAPEENRAAAPESRSNAAAIDGNAIAPAMESPAGAPPSSGPDAILGAIAGPCGSEKAADFMGRVWSPQTEAALKARTGAVGVLVMDPNGGTAHVPLDVRRVDVLLGSRNQIIHLVCG